MFPGLIGTPQLACTRPGQYQPRAVPTGHQQRPASDKTLPVGPAIQPASSPFPSVDHFESWRRARLRERPSTPIGKHLQAARRGDAEGQNLGPPRGADATGAGTTEVPAARARSCYPVHTGRTGSGATNRTVRGARPGGGNLVPPLTRSTDDQECNRDANQDHRRKMRWRYTSN